MSEFAKTLTDLRTRSGQSLENICEKAGIPPSRLTELERGIRIPTEGQIQKLEAVYQLEQGALAKLADQIALPLKW